MSIVIGIILFITAAYLFLIMPRIADRPDYTPLMGWHYAHRGLHDNASDAPENSMAAFQLAVEHGYGIELDVQLTKDKLPVVFHDDTLKRVCGIEGRVSQYTYEELQGFSLYGTEQKIPLFQDVLDLVDGQVPLVVEYKMPTSSTLVCDVADPLLKNYDGVYCIESFHPFAVRWYKEHRPEVVRGQLSANFAKEKKGKEPFEQMLVHYLLTNVLCRPDFVAYKSADAKNLSRVLCKNLFDGLAVAWTIRSQEELDARKKDFDLFIFESFAAENKF